MCIDMKISKCPVKKKLKQLNLTQEDEVKILTIFKISNVSQNEESSNDSSNLENSSDYQSIYSTLVNLTLS